MVLEGKKVTTLRFDREGHCEHKLASMRTAGWQLSKLVYGDVHEYKAPRSMTLVSDIGEQKSDPVEQLTYSRKRRQNFERLVYETGAKNICYKELCPWDPQAVTFMERHGMEAVRVPYARNSSSEVYLVTGVKAPDLTHLASELVERMDVDGPTAVVTTTTRLEGLDRCFKQPKPDPNRRGKLPEVDYSETISNLRVKYGRIEAPRNKYRSVTEVGWIPRVGDSKSGTVMNSIMYRLLRNIGRDFLTGWSLTDTSAAGTFGVYDEKVDQPTKEEHEYSGLEREVWDMLADRTKRRAGRLTFPRLTTEEGIARLRMGVAGGEHGTGWAEDPLLHDKVAEEMAGIEACRPKSGHINTMGKREKKPRQAGRAKGSRLISYYDAPVRICEQILLARLLDWLLLRENLPTAVGHMNPIDYFQNMAEEELEGGRGVRTTSAFVADDIAGWDTRISKQDLEEMHRFFTTMIGQDRGVTGMFAMYASHLTLLKRPDGTSTGMSIIREEKGVLSGYVCTYVGNTVLNTIKTIAHCCLSGI